MERLTFDGNFCDIAQFRELPCPHGGNCTQRHGRRGSIGATIADALKNIRIITATTVAKRWMNLILDKQKLL